MKLEGSCYCGTVSYELESLTPYPYMLCYCSICRKTNGGGGYAINIMGRVESLDVRTEVDLVTYRAPSHRTESGGEGLSQSRRRFCPDCGTGLWVHNPSYEQWVYPFASTVDTDLPTPPERNHIMLDYKPDWVPVPASPEDNRFGTYPDLSIREWHEKHDLLEEPS